MSTRIGLDIDGVLFPFGDRLRQYILDNSDYSEDDLSPHPNSKWEFYEVWGFDKGWYEYWIEKFIQQNGFVEGPVIGGKETIAALELLPDDVEIVLITARAEHVHDRQEVINQTVQWLYDSDIPYEEIHFTSDKSSIEVDYFLDDRVENWKEMWNVSTSFLMAQPWNAEFEGDDNRVSSVAQYLNKVFYIESMVKAIEMQRATPATSSILEGIQIGDFPVPAFPEPGFPPSQQTWNEEIRVTNEKTGGQKGSKLARYDLLPAGPLKQVAEHYGRGANKYSDRNWELGYDWNLSFAAMQRHAWQFWNGEDIDEETGGPHLAAVVFHAFALLEFMNTHPELDNRPKVQSREGK